MEQYGYLYCKYIDIAIAQGYNQRLKFDVLKNRGLGDDVCDMRLRNAHVTGADEVEFALRDMNKPMGVSEYTLVEALPENLKGALPSVAEIENDLQQLQQEEGE